MSERERWVVYPLLFLALGAALRDKLFDRTITRSVVCEELIVVDEETAGQQPLVLARIGRSNSPRGGGSAAHMVVNGQLDVDLLNAKAFAYRNLPFVPQLQAMWPGPFDFWRSLQQSMKSRARVNPPNATTRNPPSLAPQQAPETREEPGAVPPLADPSENR